MTNFYRYNKMTTFNDLENNRHKQKVQNPALDPNNIRPKKCGSCPFRLYGDGIRSEYSVKEYIQLQDNIRKSSLVSNRYCHNDEVSEKKIYSCM